MTDAYLTNQEMQLLGFAVLGDNVKISRKASIYGASHMQIASNVRIDDFCLLSGKIQIGNHVHIAPYTSLCGGNSGITIGDFANLSRKIEVFAVSDDFSGETLTNPTIPDEFKNVLDAPVHIERHVLIGATSVILPGVTLGEGCVVGALSLVKENLQPWMIYAGAPAKRIKPRSKNLLALEKTFRAKHPF